MNLFSTTFRTFDNQTIHVPNNEIWNHVITNITANPTRRVDLEFGISYNDDFEQAEQIMQDVVTSHPLVLSDPAPVVVRATSRPAVFPSSMVVPVKMSPRMRRRCGSAWPARS
jgi:small-conductance mechanosensitive channel